MNVPAALLHARVDDLAARFADIAATRMAGIALCHPGLEVAPVGFAPDLERMRAGVESDAFEGVVQVAADAHVSIAP